MIPSQLIEQARLALPQCTRLSQAEALLGGGFDDALGTRALRGRAALVWGLFDGYRDRPRPDNCALGTSLKLAYEEAHAVGRRLALEKAHDSGGYKPGTH